MCDSSENDRAGLDREIKTTKTHESVESNHTAGKYFILHSFDLALFDAFVIIDIRCN